MGKNDLSFDDFLSDVDPKYHDFVKQTHEFMLECGCTLKMALAKNGYVVSYNYGKKKRVIMNFVFRKGVLFSRIYGDYVGQYADILDTFPKKIIKSITKAPVCKRFEDPSKCNQKCGGYMFTMNGTQYQKCRYSCFLFAVDDESIPVIRTLYEHELKCRHEQA